MLDVARELGFATTWFAPEGDRANANEHPLLRRFAPADDDPEPDNPTRPDSAP